MKNFLFNRLEAARNGGAFPKFLFVLIVSLLMTTTVVIGLTITYLIVTTIYSLTGGLGITVFSMFVFLMAMVALFCFDEQVF